MTNPESGGTSRDGDRNGHPETRPSVAVTGTDEFSTVADNGASERPE